MSVIKPLFHGINHVEFREIIELWLTLILFRPPIFCFLCSCSSIDLIVIKFASTDKFDLSTHRGQIICTHRALHIYQQKVSHSAITIIIHSKPNNITINADEPYNYLTLICKIWPFNVSHEALKWSSKTCDYTAIERLRPHGRGTFNLPRHLTLKLNRHYQNQKDTKLDNDGRGIVFQKKLWHYWNLNLFNGMYHDNNSRSE